MKILYITTIGGTMGFFKSFIRHLLDEGHTVDIATNEKVSKVPVCYREWGCAVYQIDTSRSPFDTGNVKAIGQIKQLAERGNYDIVHCHTPVAAVCTRLACRNARRSGTKVFYTAHGFHFYKGAPLKNWLMYYPAEKLCAHFTDVLITINKEDYALAQRKMKAKRVAYVPGVGIDLNKFGQGVVDRAAKRKELGLSENTVWLLNIGELIPRKNQETLIRAIAEIDGVSLMIAGQGTLREKLEQLVAELGISDRVKFLGYRNDISELCAACDIFAFPSFHEGLPVALMEAMATGLPVVCSRIRGNTDLIDENGGVLFDPHSVEECRDAITTILRRDNSEMAAYNLKKIQVASIEEIIENMDEIYGGGYSCLIALIQRQKKRKELGVPLNAILLLSVGELNANKNHETVIRAIAGLNVYYIIAGEGELREHLQSVIGELGLTERVKLLGYRSDVAELYRVVDICVFPSFREGLGMAAIEGMACGLPLVAADNRGTRDYCRHGVNGLLCRPSDTASFADAIKCLSADSCLRLKMAEANVEAVKGFDILQVNEQMYRLYQMN